MSLSAGEMAKIIIEQGTLNLAGATFNLCHLEALFMALAVRSDARIINAAGVIPLTEIGVYLAGQVHLARAARERAENTA